MSMGRISAAERHMLRLKKLLERQGAMGTYLDDAAAKELARRLKDAKRRVGDWVYPDGDPPGWDESKRFRTGCRIADRLNDAKLRMRMWRAAGVEPKRVVSSEQAEPPTAQTDDGP